MGILLMIRVISVRAGVDVRDRIGEMTTYGLIFIGFTIYVIAMIKFIL
jgi:hypothetical protein